MAKKVFKIIGLVIGAVILLAAALIAWLSAAEYKPAAVEDTEIIGAGTQELKTGESVTVVTWNIGYGGLGAGSDFFMDGGENVKSADEETVNAYLSDIAATIDEIGADVALLQEVDRDSSRTYGIDETERLSYGASSFALNYSCPFVPYPLPPIGRVNSGVMTSTVFEITEAQRVSLPSPFSWPVSAANLKRCLLVTSIPVEGTDKELVLINLHLEAYDDGEGKAAQTAQLRELIAAVYAEGNYVIAGGDFNQTFPGALEPYPIKNRELWTPGVLDESLLADGFSFRYDLTQPTCRLLNMPYDEQSADTQFYIIDGFIVSPNVNVESIETINKNFRSSDHNPVKMVVSLSE